MVFINCSITYFNLCQITCQSFINSPFLFPSFSIIRKCHWNLLSIITSHKSCTCSKTFFAAYPGDKQVSKQTKLHLVQNAVYKRNISVTTTFSSFIYFYSTDLLISRKLINILCFLEIERSGKMCFQFGQTMTNMSLD